MSEGLKGEDNLCIWRMEPGAKLREVKSEARDRDQDHAQGKEMHKAKMVV